MIVHNHIKHINTIGLAAAKAAANPIVCRGLLLCCTHDFLGLDMLYIYVIYIYIYIYIYIDINIYIYIYIYTWCGDLIEISTSPHTISQSAYMVIYEQI